MEKGANNTYMPQYMLHTFSSDDNHVTILHKFFSYKLDNTNGTIGGVIVDSLKIKIEIIRLCA